MRAEKLDGRRGGGEGGRGEGEGGGSSGPHYKFNLTNGSENLETMEYMKCGRVYHDGRHGVVPAAILSGPIHILRERARGWGARGWTMGYRRKSDRKGKTHCWHDKKSRDTRTVPVARSNHHVYPFDSATTWIFRIYPDRAHRGRDTSRGIYSSFRDDFSSMITSRIFNFEP